MGIHWTAKAPISSIDGSHFDRSTKAESICDPVNSSPEGCKTKAGYIHTFVGRGATRVVLIFANRRGAFGTRQIQPTSDDHLRELLLPRLG